MIIHPMVNPEEQRMEQTRKSKLWASLKERNEDITAIMTSLTALNGQIRAMRLCGPAESFKDIASYVQARNKFMTTAQNYLDVMAKWEQAYFEWMAEEHGESTVTTKLAQAMKGLDNE